MKVSEYLSVGKENAVPAADLCKRIGIDRRTLYAEVRQERLDGVLILPDYNKGYYIADPDTAAGRDEIRTYERRMSSLGRNTLDGVNALRKAAADGKAEQKE